MEVTKIIAKLEYLNASASGNPRYKVTCTDGSVYRTEADSAVNYGLENSELRDVPVVFTLTPDGRISHARPA